AEGGIGGWSGSGVQTCALRIGEGSSSPQRVIPGDGADEPSMVVRPGTSRPEASLIPPPTANSMVPPSRAALASASRNDPGPESEIGRASGRERGEERADGGALE